MALDRVPKALRSGLLGLALLAGIGGTAWLASDTPRVDPYIQQVAADDGASDAVKVAMVLAWFYESSYQLKGKPYVDSLGKGKPWTVCNGITPAVAPINPNRTYTAAACYRLEAALYRGYEQDLRQMLPGWNRFTVFQQATFLDFVHHFGLTAFRASSMYRLALAGNGPAACAEHVKWTLGTINGVKRTLPGLVTRADSNAALCAA